MKYITLLLGVILGIAMISLAGAYTAPSYTNVTITLGNSYTAPLYTNVTIVLGDAATASDSCTYSGSGNWAIICSDNCSLVLTNMNSNNFTISGIGAIKGLSNIKSYKYGWILGGCKVYL